MCQATHLCLFTVGCLTKPCLDGHGVGNTKAQYQRSLHAVAGIVENGLLVTHLRQDVRSRILSLTGRRVVQLEPRSANGHRSRPAAERRPRRPPRRREELRRRQLQRLRSGGLLGWQYCPLTLS